jgi:hypothetical protein
MNFRVRTSTSTPARSLRKLSSISEALQGTSFPTTSSLCFDTWLDRGAEKARARGESEARISQWGSTTAAEWPER